MGLLNKNPSRRNTLSAFLAQPVEAEKSPALPAKQWGGCVDGCNHESPKKQGEKAVQLPPPAESSKPARNEREDHALAHQEPTPHDHLDGTFGSPSATRPTALPSYLRSAPTLFLRGRHTARNAVGR